MTLIFRPLEIGIGIGIAIGFLAGCFDTDTDTDCDHQELAIVGGAMLLGWWVLPLVGYDGSSMVVTCIAIALLLRVDSENRDRRSSEQ